MAGQPTPTPQWKQEVNRRIAAHKSRRGPATAEQDPQPETHLTAGSRAAQAAARVAARYAQAPSYNQLQSAEVRTAVRAAEIATQVALEAQAAARAALAGLNSAAPSTTQAAPPAPARPKKAKPRPEPLAHTPPPPAPIQPFEVLWQADTLPQQPGLDPQPPHPVEAFAPPARDSRQRSIDIYEACPEESQAANHDEPNAAHHPIDRLAQALPALPFHANLIEFPHEASAPRKAAPRLAADFYPADDHDLSIFEVDPGHVSIEAAADETWAPPTAFQWTGIELETPLEEELEPAPELASELPVLEPAPFSLRLMAALVDGSLIAAGLVAAALLAIANIDHPPSLRVLEIGALAAFVLSCIVYQALFFTLAESTPGMKYARISLCTFDDQSPTRAQLHGRLGAFLLSLIPLGMGFAWSVFDDQHLSWHDRLSRTYQRKCEI